MFFFVEIEMSWIKKKKKKKILLFIKVEINLVLKVLDDIKKRSSFYFFLMDWL